MNMWLSCIFYIDKNIIQIINNKNTKLLYYNFIDITLKATQDIDKVK